MSYTTVSTAVQSLLSRATKQPTGGMTGGGRADATVSQHHRPGCLEQLARRLRSHTQKNRRVIQDHRKTYTQM